VLLVIYKLFPIIFVSMKKSLVRFFVICVGMLLLGIQFIRPVANNDIIYSSNHINTIVFVSDTIETILQAACYDCHSNQTNYPWYTQIQPIGFWLNHHVEEGKQELNFSAFASYKKKKQLHKLDECIEMIEEGEMPLTSYSVVHQNARLNEAEKKSLIEWVKGSKTILTNTVVTPN
jgi:hypothetical protein